MSESSVIDSSALLALLFSEPAADVVNSVFSAESAVLISAVSVAEVVAKLIDQGTREADVDSAVAVWGTETVPFTHGLAIASGKLRPATRHLGLSLGDRACLALAASLGAPVMTADRQWANLDVGVEIRLIR